MQGTNPKMSSMVEAYLARSNNEPVAAPSTIPVAVAVPDNLVLSGPVQQATLLGSALANANNPAAKSAGRYAPVSTSARPSATAPNAAPRAMATERTNNSAAPSSASRPATGTVGGASASSSCCLCCCPTNYFEAVACGEICSCLLQCFCALLGSA